MIIYENTDLIGLCTMYIHVLFQSTKSCFVLVLVLIKVFSVGFFLMVVLSLFPSIKKFKDLIYFVSGINICFKDINFAK